MNRSRTNIRLFLPLAAMLAMAACSRGDPLCPGLPGGGRYCLQSTRAVAPFDVQQKIELTFDGRRETMIVELEVDNDAMRFAGLTPFGHTLVQASYDNREVGAAILPDKRLDPALLLALLQLALWPSESVRGGLDDASVLEDGAAERRLVNGGELIVEVSYTGARLPHGNLRIVLPAAQMELQVTTLDTQSTK